MEENEKDIILYKSVQEIDILTDNCSIKELAKSFISYISDGIGFNNLMDLIPSCESTDYYNFKNQLGTMLKEEKKEIEEIINNSNDKEEILEFKQILIYLNNGENDFNNYYKDDEITNIINDDKNKLFFANFTAFTSLFEKNIDDIPEIYYPQIKKALEIVSKLNKDDIYTYSNKRHFNNNNKLKKVTEIKTKNIRLIYQHIYDNNYFIIGVLEKRTQIDNGYRNKLKHIINVAQQDFDIIKDLIIKNNGEAITTLHSEYLNNIYEKLDKSKVKEL